MVRAAFALVMLFAAVAGIAGTGSASAAAPFVPRTRPDLVVEVTVNPAEVPPAGGNVQVAIIVRNVGDPEVPPMPLASAAAEDTPSWQCDYTVWRCAYGTLAGGGEAETLTVPLHLPSGSVGDAATVSATATTSSHETAMTNNTDKARVTGPRSPTSPWS